MIITKTLVCFVIKHCDENQKELFSHSKTNKKLSQIFAIFDLNHENKQEW